MHAGYVWNGMVHQTRPQAVGGAMAMGVLAAVSHAALPEFDAHKFALSVLLDTGYVRDGEDGALRAHTTSPPVLAAYSHSAARAYVFGALSQLSPVREISEEEYEGIKSNNPIVISSRRCVAPLFGFSVSRAIASEVGWVVQPRTCVHMFFVPRPRVTLNCSSSLSGSESIQALFSKPPHSH